MTQLSQPLHHWIMFGQLSGVLIVPRLCMDNPLGILQHFDQKCSNYIRQKPKNFSKSVQTTIRVCHLYSGVLVKLWLNKNCLTQFHISLKGTKGSSLKEFGTQG